MTQARQNVDDNIQAQKRLARAKLQPYQARLVHPMNELIETFPNAACFTADIFIHLIHARQATPEHLEQLRRILEKNVENSGVSVADHTIPVTKSLNAITHFLYKLGALTTENVDRIFQHDSFSSLGLSTVYDMVMDACDLKPAEYSHFHDNWLTISDIASGSKIKDSKKTEKINLLTNSRLLTFICEHLEHSSSIASALWQLNASHILTNENIKRVVFRAPALANEMGWIVRVLHENNLLSDTHLSKLPLDSISYIATLLGSYNSSNLLAANFEFLCDSIFISQNKVKALHWLDQHMGGSSQASFNRHIEMLPLLQAILEEQPDLSQVTHYDLLHVAMQKADQEIINYIADVVFDNCGRYSMEHNAVDVLATYPSLAKHFITLLKENKLFYLQNNSEALSQVLMYLLAQAEQGHGYSRADILDMIPALIKPNLRQSPLQTGQLNLLALATRYLPLKEIESIFSVCKKEEIDLFLFTTAKADTSLLYAAAANPDTEVLANILALRAKLFATAVMPDTKIVANMLGLRVLIKEEHLEQYLMGNGVYCAQALAFLDFSYPNAASVNATMLIEQADLTTKISVGEPPEEKSALRFLIEKDSRFGLVIIDALKVGQCLTLQRNPQALLELVELLKAKDWNQEDITYLSDLGLSAIHSLRNTAQTTPDLSIRRDVKQKFINTLLTQIPVEQFVGYQDKYKEEHRQEEMTKMRGLYHAAASGKTESTRKEAYDQLLERQKHAPSAEAATLMLAELHFNHEAPAAPSKPNPKSKSPSFWTSMTSLWNKSQPQPQAAQPSPEEKAKAFYKQLVNDNGKHAAYAGWMLKRLANNDNETLAALLQAFELIVTHDTTNRVAVKEFILHQRESNNKKTAAIAEIVKILLLDGGELGVEQNKRWSQAKVLLGSQFGSVMNTCWDHIAGKIADIEIADKARELIFAEIFAAAPAVVDTDLSYLRLDSVVSSRKIDRQTEINAPVRTRVKLGN